MKGPATTTIISTRIATDMMTVKMMLCRRSHHLAELARQRGQEDQEREQGEQRGEGNRAGLSRAAVVDEVDGRAPHDGGSDTQASPDALTPAQASPSSIADATLVEDLGVLEVRARI